MSVGFITDGVLRRIAQANTPQKTFSVIEHETIRCPEGIIREDGTLDVYEDVRKRFEVTYQGNHPAVRVRGWIGYIPLNKEFGLEVSTRVPIGNLERLVNMAAGHKKQILENHLYSYGATEFQPESLLDLMSDQLLHALEYIWEYGLLKDYKRRTFVGPSPRGRILPFESDLLSVTSGKPVAASSAFVRTPDFGPNRVLRYAIEKLLIRYVRSQRDGQKRRIRALRAAFDRLSGIRQPLLSELSPAAISRFIQWVPAGRAHNINALLISQLVVLDLGISLRGSEKTVVVPSILIDMADVFERSMRRILVEGLKVQPRYEVRDGNLGGSGGAKRLLFDPFYLTVKNPDITPDIVVLFDGKPVLVIDAKYKEAGSLPERPDINQAVLYGAKYDVNKIVLLHASRPAGCPTVEKCGNIGAFEVYNAMVNLNATPIEDEEKAFVSAISSLLPSS